MYEDPSDTTASLRTDIGFNITAEATACGDTCDDITADRKNGLNLRRLHLEDDACSDKSSSDQGSD